MTEVKIAKRPTDHIREFAEKRLDRCFTDEEWTTERRNCWKKVLHGESYGFKGPFNNANRPNHS